MSGWALTKVGYLRLQTVVLRAGDLVTGIA